MTWPDMASGKGIMCEEYYLILELIYLLIFVFVFK